VNLFSNRSIRNKSKKNRIFQATIFYFLDKSLERKATLHTRAFSLQDSRNFSNHFLTKFEKSRLFALHTLISADSLLFVFDFDLKWMKKY